MSDRPTARIEGGRRFSQGSRKTPVLVSIVTVVFRARHGAPPLLESVFACQDERLELIVIDGGSDDGTVELLRDSNDSIDYWISEPDQGIYDAMNKGLAAASGDYVLHLNAGDRLRLVPYEALRKSADDGVDVASFCVNMAGWGVFRPKVGLLLRINNTLHHQGTFYRRKNHLGYDTRYRVFADFDCNQRLLMGRPVVQVVQGDRGGSGGTRSFGPAGCKTGTLSNRGGEFRDAVGRNCTRLG